MNCPRCGGPTVVETQGFYQGLARCAVDCFQFVPAPVPRQPTSAMRRFCHHVLEGVCESCKNPSCDCGRTDGLHTSRCAVSMKGFANTRERDTALDQAHQAYGCAQHEVRKQERAIADAVVLDNLLPQAVARLATARRTAARAAIAYRALAAQCGAFPHGIED